MAYKIYSIESRKGGVGKTTIALNLAKRLLRSRKEPVLLIDCDITGTSITYPAEKSPFWEKETNVLKDSKGNYLNFLGYYKDSFIKGRSRKEAFVTKENVQENKINVIGSNIYSTSKTAIIDTRMLMDDIHSFWLVEFLNAVIESFQNLFSSKTVHVIVDNSPGYVGFCESLHNYMYSLGPDNAKFILVSSFDGQDLIACMQASDEICYNVANRSKIANYFKKTHEGSDTDSQLEELISEDDNLKQFYFMLREDQALLDSYSITGFDEKYYLSLIINRVPQVYKEDRIYLSFEEIVTDQYIELFNKVSSAKDGSPQAIVYYDEAIVYQNYLKYLKVRGDEKDTGNYWARRLRDLDEYNNEYEQMEDVISAVRKLETLYGNLLTSLNQKGFARMARQMSRQWSPVFPLTRFGEIISSMARRTLQRPHTGTQERKELLHAWTNTQLKLLNEYVNHSELHQIMAIASYAEEIAGVWKEDVDERPLERLALFICSYVKVLIASRCQDESIWQYLKKNCASDMTGSEALELLGDEIIISPGYILNVVDYRRFFDLYYNRFHQYFSYALIRMMDRHEDFKVILSTLRLYIQGETLLPLSKEIIDYLNSVITRKDELFDADKLVEIKNNSFVMQNAQVVLRDYVLKNWK